MVSWRLGRCCGEDVRKWSGHRAIAESAKAALAAVGRIVVKLAALEADDELVGLAAENRTDTVTWVEARWISEAPSGQAGAQRLGEAAAKRGVRDGGLADDAIAMKARFGLRWLKALGVE
jgi:hypothetical protein